MGGERREERGEKRWERGEWREQRAERRQVRPCSGVLLPDHVAPEQVELPDRRALTCGGTTTKGINLWQNGSGRARKSSVSPSRCTPVKGISLWQDGSGRARKKRRLSSSPTQLANCSNEPPVQLYPAAPPGRPQGKALSYTRTRYTRKTEKSEKKPEKIGVFTERAVRLAGVGAAPPAGIEPGGISAVLLRTVTPPGAGADHAGQPQLPPRFMTSTHAGLPPAHPPPGTSARVARSPERQPGLKHRRGRGRGRGRSGQRGHGRVHRGRG